MPRFFAALHGGGYVVIMNHAALGNVVEGEYHTAAAAEKQAKKLNDLDRARELIAEIDEQRRQYIQTFEGRTVTPRKSVRYFFNEDIHG